MQAPTWRNIALATGALAGAALIVTLLLKMPPHAMLPAALAQSKSAKAKTPVPEDHPAIPSAPPGPENAWSDAEIISALEECLRLLVPTGADLELSKPIRNGQCGTPVPVVLKRVAGVELNPAAVVNCQMAAKVQAWINESLQPLAREQLDARVTRLITASAYMCRQRLGSSTERLSEHSFANALDISAFVTSDGRSIDVLTRWGPTKRDRQAQAAPDAVAGGDARPVRDIAPLDGTTTTEGRFLRSIHEGACGTFATVLGPEANEAHRNHLHLDLAARRRGAFCE
jgi:hypothetical protein